MARKHKEICKCGKEMALEWVGNGVQFPTYVCECGNIKNEWQKWYEVYKDRWQEKENWSKTKELPSCIVGYFIHKYFEHYGQPFAFSYSSPIPYKDKAFTMARRLMAMFASNPADIKVYIKWILEKRINKHYVITSLGFFVNDNLVNEFKVKKEKSKALKRTSTLPEDFLSWCNSECPDIFNRQELKTWSDLNGLMAYIRCYGENNVEGVVINEAIKRNLISDGQFKKLMEG